MKYFSIILSMIIIILIAVPCDHVPADLNVQEDVVSTQHHNDSENSDHLCSPFSTHDSCATVVILPNIFQESLHPGKIGSELNTSYIFSFSKDFTNSIFQPPRA
jgi:hypothetical protein